MTEQWNGVPENPERDGWHWLSVLRGVSFERPRFWHAKIARWELSDGELIAPHECTERWRYLGPCLTPAEITAREAASAEAMREACAASCMEPVANTIPRRWKSARDCAEGIYALPLPHASALVRALAAAEKRGMERAAGIARDLADKYQTGGERWPERAAAAIAVETAIRNAAAQESEG